MHKIVPRFLDPEILKFEVMFLSELKLCELVKDQLHIDMNIALKSLHDDGTYLSLADLERESKNNVLVKAVLLDKLNEFVISKDLKERFYDYRILGILTCLFSNLWVENKTLFKANSSVKNFFRITDNLSVGQWGLVFRARRGGSELDFIIKSQANPASLELSVHEAFITMTTLNHLRGFCLNYACTYGIFMCGKPDAIGGKICTTDDDDTIYVVSEDIEGKSIADFIKGVTDETVYDQTNLDRTTPFYIDLLSMILQLAFALRIGYERGNRFTHRDLHYGNVICRPLAKSQSLKYDTRFFLFNDIDKACRGQDQPELSAVCSRTIHYVKSRYIATIIDFDWGKIYLPITTETSTTYRLFGKLDEENTNGVDLSTPGASKMRDLMKIFAYITYACYENKKIDERFAVMLMIIYVDTFLPYNTIYARTAHQTYPDLFDRKHSGIERKDSRAYKTLFFSGSEHMYIPDKIQKVYMDDGLINYDLFLNNFKTHVPELLLNDVLFERDFEPHPDKNPRSMLDNPPELRVLNGMAEKALGAPVFTCGDPCPSPEEIYKSYNDYDLRKELEQTQSAIGNETNAVYHALRLQNSRQIVTGHSVAVRSSLRLKDQEGKIPNVVKGNFDYRELMTSRLNNLINQESDNNFEEIKRIYYKIKDNVIKTRATLALRRVLPNPDQFTVNMEVHLTESRKVVMEMFTAIEKCKSAIILNNGLSLFKGSKSSGFKESDQKISSRQLLIDVTRELEMYYNNVLIPWRKKLESKVANNTLGDYGYDFQLFVTSKIPDQLIFDPIQ